MCNAHVYDNIYLRHLLKKSIYYQPLHNYIVCSQLDCLCQGMDLSLVMIQYVFIGLNSFYNQQGTEYRRDSLQIHTGTQLIVIIRQRLH